MRTTAALIGGVTALAVVGVLHASSLQTHAPARTNDPAPPAFEVTSVKQNTSGHLSTAAPPHDVYRAQNVSLGMLVQWAYGLAASEVVGGPSWREGIRFDVIGKFEDDASADEQLQMLRQLLVDRFKLQVHRTQKELHVYTLERVHDDGRLGPQLLTATRDCTKEDELDPKAAMKLFADGLSPDCGKFFSWPQRVAGTATDVSLLVRVLGARAGLDGPIVDKTGLSGTFDWDLTWTPSGPSTTNADPFGVSIFTALEEQLGLRLRPSKNVVDVVVIDHAELPTPD
jgi:uncharacterized protein (TIGR03435 family)